MQPLHAPESRDGEMGGEINVVEPGYNDIGLYDTSSIASHSLVVPINSSLLTTILNTSVITILGFNDTRYNDTRL